VPTFHFPHGVESGLSVVAQLELAEEELERIERPAVVTDEARSLVALESAGSPSRPPPPAARRPPRQQQGCGEDEGQQRDRDQRSQHVTSDSPRTDQRRGHRARVVAPRKALLKQPTSGDRPGEVRRARLPLEQSRSFTMHFGHSACRRLAGVGGHTGSASGARAGGIPRARTSRA